MKLKTLKDLDNPVEENSDGSFGDMDAVYIDDLKQEGIKWIKEIWEGDEDKLMKEYGPKGKQIFHDFEPSCECGVVKGFIQYFFNITEEDLK